MVKPFPFSVEEKWRPVTFHLHALCNLVLFGSARVATEPGLFSGTACAVILPPNPCFDPFGVASGQVIPAAITISKTGV
jgi:hypothetical protein